MSDSGKKKKKKKNWLKIGGCGLLVILILTVGLFVIFSDGGTEPADVVTSNKMIRVDIDLSTYTNAHCNDGSNPVFYYRLATSEVNATKWIFHVNGGGNCHSELECAERWLETPDKMGSTTWSDDKDGSGIYNDDPEVSPQFHDWNAVTILYCSSDFWTGTSTPETSGTEWYFEGEGLLESMWYTLADMDETTLFTQATEVVVAGRTAGAIGVLANYLTFSETITSLATNSTVYGMIDSGWAVDMDAFVPQNCTQITNETSCTIRGMVETAADLWLPQLPTRCSDLYHGEDFWKCYYGSYVYPLLNADEDVFFNEFTNNDLQYSMLGLWKVETEEEIAYAVSVSEHMLAEMETAQVTGLYSAACPNHGVITGNDWTMMTIDEQILPNVLGDWFYRDVWVVDNCTDFDPPLWCSEICPDIV
jgi:hypothetical protein